MKITDPDVIKNGEKDLIDSVKEDLDLDTIKELMQNKMHAKTLLSKGGEIVVHNNEIAFRLDFSFEIQGSLMFDRQGNYIPESDEQQETEDIEPDDLELDDQLEINLPDYDLEEDEEDQEDALPIDDLEEDAGQEDTLPIDALDPLTDEADTISDPESGSESEIKEDNLIQNDIIDDDIVDDDINDILKESQDFWETKKNE